MYTFTQPLTRALDTAAGSCAVVTDFAAAHGVTLIPGTQSRALIICKLQAALGHGTGRAVMRQAATATIRGLGCPVKAGAGSTRGPARRAER